MIYALFTCGGVLFWILLGLLLFIEIVCIENDHKAGATISPLAFVGLVWLFGDFHLIDFAKANWLYILIGTGVYFIAGLLWCIIKWEFFVSKKRRQFAEFKERWMSDNGCSGQEVIPDNIKSQWVVAVLNRYDYDNFNREYNRKGEVYPPERIMSLVVPRAAAHKSDIMFWLSHWPFSMFWTLVRDFLYEVWEFVYNKTVNILSWRAQRQFRGVEKDFMIAPASLPKNQSK